LHDFDFVLFENKKKCLYILLQDSTEETEGRVSPSDTVESANKFNNIKEALDMSVCQPTSDIIMGDVMLVNSTSQETNGHNKNE
jgi:hypothetical protein